MIEVDLEEEVLVDLEAGALPAGLEDLHRKEDLVVHQVDQV